MGSDQPTSSDSTQPGATTLAPQPMLRNRLKLWAFNSSFAHRKLSLRAEELLDRINFADHLVPDGIYVDIGSGTGHNAARMARVGTSHNATILCIEPETKPTRRVLKHIERRSPGRVEFVRALGNEIPRPDDFADGASIFFVLHHIPYEIQLDVLREVARVLKPGGKLFIWEDTPENEAEFLANEVWDRRLNFEPKSEPHFYRSGDAWAELFGELGFTVIARQYYEDHSPRKREGTIRHTGFVLGLGEAGDS